MQKKGAVVSGGAGEWGVLLTLFQPERADYAHYIKVEIFLEQREVAFLSPSKNCKNLNFSTEIQIFPNFAGW